MSHIQRQLRIQASSLFKQNKLTTTTAKARKLKRFAQSLLSQIAAKDLEARRKLKSVLFSEKAIKNALQVQANTKIKLYKLAKRHGDNAPLTQVVLQVQKQVVKKSREKS